MAKRLGAAAVDGVLLLLLLGVMVAIFGEARSPDGESERRLNGELTFVYFLLALAYYFAMESKLGATYGKKWLGLRVAGEDGGPATVRQVAIRTAMRIVDFLPVFYLVGLVAVLATPSDHRLGDLVAKTHVVSDS